MTEPGRPTRCTADHAQVIRHVDVTSSTDKVSGRTLGFHLENPYCWCDRSPERTADQHTTDRRLLFPALFHSLLSPVPPHPPSLFHGMAFFPQGIDIAANNPSITPQSSAKKLPTPVIYPVIATEQGTSAPNSQAVPPPLRPARDTHGLTRAAARLGCGMIRHAPRIALPLTALLVGAAPAPATAAASSPYDAVVPFIGTGGEGHTYPGAVAPFCMVQLSPDTDTTCVIRACYSHAAGYRSEDPPIQGFSHTHYSGAGHSDLGDFLVMPAVGEDAGVPLEPGDAKHPGDGYRSAFDHRSEVAHPGYYAVTLSGPDVRAELTAGTRIGVHRYTFPSGKAAHLVLDLRTSLYDYPGKILWSSVRITPDGLVTGMRETRGWAPARKLWFAMRFSAPLAGHAFQNREENVAYKGVQGPGRGDDGVAMLAGRALVARLDFGRLRAPLEVKVALSSVDEAGALANLAAEPGNFDAVRARTRAAWSAALGAVSLDAAPAMRKTLYTALYHSLLAPNVAGDVDGRYRGPDNEVHEATG